MSEATPKEHGMKRYKERNHLMTKLPRRVLEHVERHLDMLLRPDPAASDERHVCIVYSPEVNTHEKLKQFISSRSKVDRDEILISPASLRRMIASYLHDRECVGISFAQSDHNACPYCKSVHYDILNLSYEQKQLQ